MTNRVFENLTQYFMETQCLKRNQASEAPQDLLRAHFFLLKPSEVLEPCRLTTQATNNMLVLYLQVV